MTETQTILHLRNVIQIACLMLESRETELVQELLSQTLKEPQIRDIRVWKERVVFPHME